MLAYVRETARHDGHIDIFRTCNLIAIHRYFIN
jgi:hypothetical protein